VKKGTYRDAPPPKRTSGEGPDVYLDVPILKVEETQQLQSTKALPPFEK
jgi:hypothetical protein